MTPVVVSSDIIGNESSILVNGRISPYQEFDTQWTIGSKKEVAHSLEELLSIYNHQVPELIPEPLRKSYQAIYGENVNWIEALGNQRFVHYLRIFVKQIQQSLVEIEKSPYFQELPETRKVLTRLSSAKIDTKKLEELLKTSDIASLKSFQPNVFGFATPVKYTSATSTGRLTVVNGPKILTLSQENRNILKSREPTGKIYIIDYISLEPRVALLLNRDEAPLDIYQEMGKMTSLDIPRSKLKISTISTLYGSGHVEKKIRQQVQKYFQLDDIYQKYLYKEQVSNLFGRPLSPKEDYQKISHFIQSTAVDIALRGFEKLCQKMPNMIPLFVIHDALVVDSLEEIDENKMIEVEVEPLGKFYLSAKPL